MRTVKLFCCFSVLLLTSCATIEPEGWDSMEPDRNCYEGLICRSDRDVDCYESDYFEQSNDGLICSKE